MKLGREGGTLTKGRREGGKGGKNDKLKPLPLTLSPKDHLSAFFVPWNREVLQLGRKGGRMTKRKKRNRRRKRRKERQTQFTTSISLIIRPSLRFLLLLEAMKSKLGRRGR